MCYQNSSQQRTDPWYSNNWSSSSLHAYLCIFLSERIAQSYCAQAIESALTSAIISRPNMECSVRTKEGQAGLFGFVTWYWSLIDYLRAGPRLNMIAFCSEAHLFSAELAAGLTRYVVSLIWWMHAKREFAVFRSSYANNEGIQYVVIRFSPRYNLGRL